MTEIFDAAEEILFLSLCTVLAAEDLRKKTVPLVLLPFAAAGGLLFHAAAVLTEAQTLPQAAAAYLPGLGIGLFLLLLTKLTRGRVGSGDGSCFLCFAFWKSWQALLPLLFCSVTLTALTGCAVILIKKKDLKYRMPLMPFVLAAEIILAAAERLTAALP